MTSICRHDRANGEDLPLLINETPSFLNNTRDDHVSGPELDNVLKSLLRIVRLDHLIERCDGLYAPVDFDWYYYRFRL
jgi:hypothetical protein